MFLVCSVLGQVAAEVNHLNVNVECLGSGSWSLLVRGWPVKPGLCSCEEIVSHVKDVHHVDNEHTGADFVKGDCEHI